MRKLVSLVVSAKPGNKLVKVNRNGKDKYYLYDKLTSAEIPLIVGKITNQYVNNIYRYRKEINSTLGRYGRPPVYRDRDVSDIMLLIRSAKEDDMRNIILAIRKRYKIK